MALYDEIQEGESRTLEFKAELPKDSENELQFRGKRIFYDSLANPSIKITNKDINSLCKEFSEKADRKITSKDLINFGLLVGEDHKTGTNACAILLGKHDFTSRIQCARFKGVDRTFFIDKKEYLNLKKN